MYLNYMNYLAKNLNNSLTLPVDVMKLIYKYADPLIAIKKQIENKEYDLHEIMYQRMKKNILSHCIFYVRYTLSNKFEVIIITQENINNPNLKEAILNYTCGYKNCYLWKHNLPTSICGLSKFPTNKEGIRINMIQDLQKNNIYNTKKINWSKYKMKNVYKKWLKL
jgi:hypothetical protein